VNEPPACGSGWVRVGDTQTSSEIEPRTVEPFEYAESADAPFVPSWNGWEEESEAPAGHAQGPQQTTLPVQLNKEEFEERAREERRRSFEAGRARGMEEGGRLEREAHAAAQAAAKERHARQARELTEDFARERDRYFQAVEHEVVKLAMAVAARILRREAQTDPLLLMGAVRVALGQLSSSTEVRLNVPAGELDLWTEAMALLPNQAVRPQLVPNKDMRLGECTVETSLGSTDLGIRAQLGEIERGFSENAGGATALNDISPEIAGVTER
jgi:flagellar assembly protein FliH